MKKKTRFKRTLDIPAEQVLTELHGKLRNLFFFQSGKKIELKEPTSLKQCIHSQHSRTMLYHVQLLCLTNGKLQQFLG